jgi:hypothetical protein
MAGYTLMVHEFLYLLCNTTDRLNQIVKNHKVRFQSEKLDIYQWELQDNIASQNRKVSHIHLLNRNAFKNEAPHVLLKTALEN